VRAPKIPPRDYRRHFATSKRPATQRNRIFFRELLTGQDACFRVNCSPMARRIAASQHDQEFFLNAHEIDRTPKWLADRVTAGRYGRLPLSVNRPFRSSLLRSHAQPLRLPHFKCKSNEICSSLKSQPAFYKIASACNSPVCDSKRVGDRREALPLPQQPHDIEFSGCQLLQ
jgi:hypothetical protein